MEKSRMNLPKGPDTLCFDKDEFMKEDFDVDHFMSDCQKRVQLEALRDDLELYYKLLKTAMVELINKDYADFVNLSTNLICVLWLIQVIPSVEKIEKILNSQHSKETSALEASSEKGSTVPGYDFLVNSVWPEIVRELEEKLPLIFNSGNPDAFHQLEANHVTTLQWVLSYIDMNQPWSYMYSPSQSSPPTSLSTRFLWVFPVHQARALVSRIPPGLVICFTIDNVHVVLSKHPTLAFSHRVQKSVLYICVSFSVLHIELSLPSF
ncbi:conserved oligomeric Golgi complex subunit 2-like isoform 2-T2 [Dama dama]|uniref:conserved oligomeric Golgi complex subunit 2-like isoform X2 n=1 Tax=Dama dama TaxID=30532 RepID=UPI002A362B9E|nr:conserved oligomeric Golgi complex subunit 2-like isoform X2 [Dama dama]